MDFSFLTWLKDIKYFDKSDLPSSKSIEFDEKSMSTVGFNPLTPFIDPLKAVEPRLTDKSSILYIKLLFLKINLTSL